MFNFVIVKFKVYLWKKAINFYSLILWKLMENVCSWNVIPLDVWQCHTVTMVSASTNSDTL